MYGWRSKISTMIPSVNATMEPEMWRVALDGANQHKRL